MNERADNGVRSRGRVWRLVVLGGLVALLLFGVSSCATFGYYGQAVWGGGKILLKRQPIEKLLERAEDAHQRSLLEQALEIRSFASSELGLPENDSYRNVVRTRSESVTWIVSAAPEFSVDPETWCFLIAGCVSYRGYFSEQRARRFARRTEERGLDVSIGTATSYSTLGWFADPIFEPQLSWPSWRLAGLVFHELAHQVFYFPGDTALNESFATAVEEWGLDRWLEQDPESRAVARAAAEQEADFVSLVLEYRQRFEDLYSSAVDRGEGLRAQKESLFEEMRRQYLESVEDEVAPYGWWFEQPLNNAHLASVADYSLWVPGLLHQLRAGGLEQLVGQLEALALAEPSEREARLQEWNEEASEAAAES